MEKLTSKHFIPIELIKNLFDANGICYNVYKDEFHNYNIEYETERLTDEICDELENIAIKFKL